MVKSLLLLSNTIAFFFNLCAKGKLAHSSVDINVILLCCVICSV